VDPSALTVYLLAVQLSVDGYMAVLPALWRYFELEDDSQDGFAARQELAWHWDCPCWPRSRLVSEFVAQELTLYRCVYCGYETTNALLATIHRERGHKGRQAAMTIYPSAIGVEPKGEG